MMQIFCSICRKLFSRQYDLKLHVNTHTQLMNYLCEYCGLRFNHISNLNRHAKRHIEESYSCKICHKSFCRASSYQKHLSSHKSTYKCAVCFRIFKSNNLLEKHSNYFHSSESLCFINEYSGSKINTNAGCKNSETEIHSNSINLFNKVSHKKEVCNISMHSPNSEDFSLKESYKTSNNLSESIIDGDCDENKSLESTSPMETSRKLNYFLVKPQSNTIQLCSKNKTAKAVQNNLSIESKSGFQYKKQFVCDVCNKVFNRKWNYEQHQGIHDSSLKKYFCHKCKLWFAFCSTYTSHMKSHEGIEIYFCNQCKKVFTRKSSMQSHTKNEHDAQRKFQCEICRKSFFRKSDFNYHIRLHKNETPYICSICGKSFSHVSNLYRHEKKPHVNEEDQSDMRCLTNQ